MKYHTLFIIIFCLLSTLTKTAKAELLGCFDCSSVTSKREAIKEFNASNKQHGRYEVVDIKKGMVLSYDIEYDPEFNKTIVFSRTPSADALNRAETLSSEYKALEQEIETKNFVSNSYTSAYKVYRSRGFGRVTNEFIHQSNIYDKIGIYTGVAVTMLGKLANNINFVIDIEFSDGSIIRFKVTGVNIDGDPEFEPMKAMDSDGNTIPTGRNDIGGIYRFSEGTGNWERFRALSSLYGINIVGWDHGYFNTSVTISDCPACSIEPN
ncbi:hypothetical protein PSECIP111951_01493 [Pseudoalteromonas holothuriae]|uniref:FTP domain-containing protein n=1 Tax=Pseudoalteromonas holothuriae TaxID=2963714 RepID=A0A9W4R280_9GAMM|nr:MULTISPECIES: hypothetical protein [unclassified Pseudoalteromonas]CAH9056597.1 hypothetical protein PSECIP111951_01493 [Pseudoalteromonas sp. CIP111951]CAH9063055.1 hypothetical protein PSECIP111854_03148 [Pseudoalteromonas sp. CIP111854]